MSEPRVVAVYLSRVEADVARATLEAAEIHTFLADDAMTRMAWLFTIAMGGTRIFVAAGDLDDAREILEARLPPPEGTNSNTCRQQEEVCPKCKCPEARYDQTETRVRAASMLLIWLGLPFKLLGVLLAFLAVLGPRHLVCGACGHLWTLKGSQIVE